MRRTGGDHEWLIDPEPGDHPRETGPCHEYGGPIREHARETERGECTGPDHEENEEDGVLETSVGCPVTALLPGPIAELAVRLVGAELPE